MFPPHSTNAVWSHCSLCHFTVVLGLKRPLQGCGMLHRTGVEEQNVEAHSCQQEEPKPLLSISGAQQVQ